MPRKSLRPQLNQIRTWVRQGRTDAWIAHKLDVTVQQIETFKKENELLNGDAPTAGEAVVDFDDEIDLRASDDALIAAELEAEAAAAGDSDDADGDDDDEQDDDRPKRRRGRRGGRGRSRARKSVEGTFDHGEEGYGLWLDPAIADDAVYAEHWAGHRQIEVSVGPDQITIRRAGEGAAPTDADDDKDAA
jgi:hypothetical protein